MNPLSEAAKLKQEQRNNTLRKHGRARSQAISGLPEGSKPSRRNRSGKPSKRKRYLAGELEERPESKSRPL